MSLLLPDFHSTLCVMGDDMAGHMGRALGYQPNRRQRGSFLGRATVAVFALFILGTASAVYASEPVASDHLVAQKRIAPPDGFLGVCDRYAWACAPNIPADFSITTDRDILRAARTVNARVNRTVRQISDEAQFNRAEHWTLPTNRGGDCEDFALEKKRQLLLAGVPTDRLMIATAMLPDTTRHAVLVVRTARGDLVLDNLTNQILPWDRTGLTFLRMQNPAQPMLWDAVFAGGMIAAPRG